MSTDGMIINKIHDLKAIVFVHHAVSSKNNTITLYYFDSVEMNAHMKKCAIEFDDTEYRKQYAEPVFIETGTNEFGWTIGKFGPRSGKYSRYVCNHIHKLIGNVIREKIKPPMEGNFTFLKNKPNRHLVYRFMVATNDFRYENYLKQIEMSRHFGSITVKSSRYNDNINRKTFDSVMIEFGVVMCGKTRDEMSQYLNVNSKNITGVAWSILKSSGEFNKYDVPVNFVEIRDVVYTRDGYLVYTFILKNESKDVVE